MSTFIPWTDPGGTPCCCNECYSNLETEPLLPYSENTWLSIGGSDYTSLLAGGTYSALINLDVTGSNATFSERHQVNNAVVGLNLSEALADNCYQRHDSSVLVTRTFGTSGTNFDYTTNVVFARSLGTANGQTFISLATICPPGSASLLPTFSSIALSGLSSLTFGIVLNAYVGNFTSFQTGLCRNAGIGFTSSLIVAGNTYAATGTTIACFQTIQSMGIITHTGSISIATTFTPAAP